MAEQSVADGEVNEDAPKTEGDVFKKFGKKVEEGEKVPKPPETQTPEEIEQAKKATEEAAKIAKDKPENKSEDVTPKKKKSRLMRKTEEEPAETEEAKATRIEAEAVEKARLEKEEADFVPQKAQDWAKAKKAISDKFEGDISAKDTKIAELEKRIQESSLQSPEYKAMQEQNTQMRERLGQLDLGNSPEFQEKFSKPAQALRQQMVNILTENEIEVTIDELLSKSGKELNLAISEVMEELPALSESTFKDAFLGYSQLNIDANAALNNFEETRGNINSQAVHNQEKAVMDIWDKVSSSDMFAKKIEPDDVNNPADVASADRYNQAIEAILPNIIRKSTGDVTDRIAAEVFIKAELYDFTTTHGHSRLEMEFDEMEAELADANKRLAAIEKHNPNIGGNGGDHNRDETPAPEAKNEEDVFKQFAKNVAKT